MFFQNKNYNNKVMSKRKFSHNNNQDSDDLDNSTNNIKKKIKKLEKDNKELKETTVKLEKEIDEMKKSITDFNTDINIINDRLDEEDDDFIDNSKEDYSDEEDIQKFIQKIIENPNEFLRQKLKEFGIKRGIEKHVKISNEYFDLIKDEGLKGKELEYFIKQNINNKKTIIENEKKMISNIEEIPLRYKILNNDLPPKIKTLILQKVNIINKMDSHSGEYHKLNQWINGVMNIKWDKFIDFPIKSYHSPETKMNFLLDAKQNLDKTIYGQTETKEHILQIIGKLITNPKTIGNVFAIYGPMGTGKTTIIKEGLSKVLGLPFNFISLGGASDSSFLDGHSYTYEGSVPGRIVECLKLSGCMNPVFYFDELDKVSDTTKGKEIINLLIHLTDSTQNTNFQDKYYSGIPFNLSRAIFVFSFNHLEKVNPILRDRMNLIKVNGFDTKDKVIISDKYLLPKIYDDFNLKKTDIIIKKEILNQIVLKYSNSETGVRNIKKILEIIFSKLNLIKITKSINTKIVFDEKNNNNKSKKSKALNNNKNNTNTNNNSNILNDKEILKNVDFNKYSFPLELNLDLINKLIKIPKSNIPIFMYS